MADKSEWKTPIMESEGKAMDTNTGESPEHQIKSQYSWETHLVRKRWDIGLLRALSLRIMMMMMMAIYINNIESSFLLHAHAQCAWTPTGIEPTDYDDDDDGYLY